LVNVPSTFSNDIGGAGLLQGARLHHFRGAFVRRVSRSIGPIPIDDPVSFAMARRGSIVRLGKALEMLITPESAAEPPTSCVESA
jgi:hypothetical protein